jgi:hypothetical protein
MGIIERIEFFPKFLFVFAPASSLLIAAGGLPTSRRLGVRSGLTGSLICDVCAPISSTNEHLAREQNRMDPVSRSTT